MVNLASSFFFLPRVTSAAAVRRAPLGFIVQEAVIKYKDRASSFVRLVCGLIEAMTTVSLEGKNSH